MWYESTVYYDRFMAWLSGKCEEYAKKAIALEALKSVFMFANEYGYEQVKNIQPQALIPLAEASQLLYDKFVEDEPQVDLALESVLSDLLENRELWLEILKPEKPEDEEEGEA